MCKFKGLPSSRPPPAPAGPSKWSTFRGKSPFQYLANTEVYVWLCKKHSSMRINTDGKKEFREDLYERASEVFDENTKVGGIDRACRHAREDVEAKAKALDWMEANLPPEQAHELCEILSTRELQVGISTETVLKTD